MVVLNTFQMTFVDFFKALEMIAYEPLMDEMPKESAISEIVT